jgi:hypothetical protein
MNRRNEMAPKVPELKMPEPDRLEPAATASMVAEFVDLAELKDAGRDIVVTTPMVGRQAFCEAAARLAKLIPPGMPHEMLCILPEHRIWDFRSWDAPESEDGWLWDFSLETFAKGGPTHKKLGGDRILLAAVPAARAFKGLPAEEDRATMAVVVMIGVAGGKE